MNSYAQTILQLLNQLRRLGYSQADLNLVQSAYGLAAVLFTGRYQPSGKSFVAHVVGTASILATSRSSAPLLAAGLLHNAYQHGDFGSLRSGMSHKKRRQMVRLLGPEVEEYVAKFSCLGWCSAPVHGARFSPDRMRSVERNVILIRLADFMEHLLDLDVLYYGDKTRRYYASNGSIAVEIAEKMGLSWLADEMRAALREIHCADLPVELPLWRVKESSFVMAPPSCCKRSSLVLCRYFGRRPYHLSQKLLRRFKAPRV